MVFAGDAEGGFGRPCAAIVAVFDFAEGVEGGGVGAAPALGEGDAAEAGDPVVGVEEFVGPAALAGDLVGACGEGVDVGGDFDGGECGGRTDIDVDDSGAGGDFDDVGQVGAVAAGVDVDEAVAGGELFGEFGDVDVHAAGFGGAGAGEGGGVGGDDGEASEVVGHGQSARRS